MRLPRVWLGPALALWAALGCAHGDPLRDATALRDLRTLAERTARLVGVDVDERLGFELLPREDVARVLREAAVVDWPPERARSASEGLVAMGLWPAELDLLAALIAASAQRVSGFYLPRHRKIYVVSDARTTLGAMAGARAPTEREFVVAHELIHAHQHVMVPELLDFFVRWHGQDDAVNAAAAAVEGHALRAAIELFAGTEALPAPEVVAGYFDAEPADRLATLPALIRLTHAFPYAAGYALAHREGARLLARAPASTEQVLHAERRAADFWAIDLARLAGHLPPGCEPVAQNSAGELGVSVLFHELTSAPDPAIWTGWDGDRYLAARCHGRRALLWVTAWDTPADAREFAAAYRGVVAAVAIRAGYAAPLQLERRGRQVRVASAALAPLLGDLDAAIRRKRVATLPALRDHFACCDADRPSAAAAPGMISRRAGGAREAQNRRRGLQQLPRSGRLSDRIGTHAAVAHDLPLGRSSRAHAARGVYPAR